MSEELCKRISKRDAEIDTALAKLLAEHPELGGANISQLRAQLATEKRTRKQKDMSRDELRTIWDAQLSKAERAALRRSSGISRRRMFVSTTLAISRWKHTPLKLWLRYGNS